MPWKAEVQTAGDGDHWSSNACVFATKEEAETYVTDLALRWTAVSDTRAVPTDEEVNYTIEDGIMVRLS